MKLRVPLSIVTVIVLWVLALRVVVPIAIDKEVIHETYILRIPKLNAKEVITNARVLSYDSEHSHNGRYIPRIEGVAYPYNILNNETTFFGKEYDTVIIASAHSPTPFLHLVGIEPNGLSYLLPRYEIGLQPWSKIEQTTYSEGVLKCLVSRGPNSVWNFFVWLLGIIVTGVLSIRAHFLIKGKEKTIESWLENFLGRKMSKHNQGKFD